MTYTFLSISLVLIWFSNGATKNNALLDVIKARLNINGNTINLSTVQSWFKVLAERSTNAEVKTCIQDLHIVLQAAKAGRKWAVQMLDSSAKPILHSIWPGKTFCQTITPDLNAENETVRFQTEFCNLQIANIFMAGVCLPESCRHQPVNDFLHNFQGHLRCTHPSLPFWKKGYVVMSLFICFILIILAVAGTSYDVFLRLKINKDLQQIRNSAQFQILTKKRNNGVEKRKMCKIKDHIIPESTLQDQILNKKIQEDGWFGTIFLSFSFYTNGLKLLNIKKGRNQLHCIHGIRVLSLMVIVYGHCFARKLFVADNILQTTDIIEKFPIYLLINGAPYVVDTFLVLSGILVSYVYFGKTEKERKKIPWLYFYLHRIIRLSPSYWFTSLILNFGLYFREGIGPVNVIKMNEQELCEKSWWRILLYVTNFQEGEQCFSSDWFLSVDMQFYILSPIFLYLMARFDVYSFVICAAVIIANSFTNWVTASQYPSIISIPRNIIEAVNKVRTELPALDHLYKRPYCRITSFLVGMMAGFLLKKYNCSIPFTKKQVLLLWCTAISGCVLAVMIPYWFYIAYETAALFYAVKYILWSSGIVSLILLCTSNNAGLINSFLSWPGWLPFSRLSFGAYLLERMMVYLLYSNIEKPLHFEFPETNFHFLCVIPVTFLGSLLLYLMIENPLYLILVKFMLPKK